MRSYVLLALLLSMQQAASAAGYLTPFGTGIAVEKYHIHGEGGITLWVSGVSNPDSCGGNSLVHVPASLPAYKTMVAAVMAAHTAGKKIGLYSSSCSTLPFWGGSATYPVISNVWVTD